MTVVCQHICAGSCISSEEQVFVSKTPLDLSYVFPLISMHEETTACLAVSAVSRRSHPEICVRDRPIMEQLLKKDALLFYPYESIDPFLQLAEGGGQR